MYLWCVTNKKYDKNSANFMALRELTSWYVTLEIQFIKISKTEILKKKFSKKSEVLTEISQNVDKNFNSSDM